MRLDLRRVMYWVAYGPWLEDGVYDTEAEAEARAREIRDSSGEHDGGCYAYCAPIVSDNSDKSARVIELLAEIQNLAASGGPHGRTWHAIEHETITPIMDRAVEALELLDAWPFPHLAAHHSRLDSRSVRISPTDPIPESAAMKALLHALADFCARVDSSADHEVRWAAEKLAEAVARIGTPLERELDTD